MRRKLFGQQAVPLLAILFSACSFSARPIYIEEEKKTVEKAILQFHDRMNAQQYAAIYDDMHEQLKSVTPNEDLISSIKSTYERTGKILGVTEHWLNYVKGDPVPVRAIYNIKCEKGDFTEWFSYVMDPHGKALLVQYQNFPGSSPAPETSSH